jgi:hypothetical protein
MKSMTDFLNEKNEDIDPFNEDNWGEKSKQ